MMPPMRERWLQSGKRELALRLTSGYALLSVMAFALAVALREGPPWAKMPLRYERAAGGPDTWNPVGVRLDGSPDLYGQKHLPNLQPEGLELVDRGQFLPPVGFGPIASTWPLRRERLGRRAFGRDEPLGDDFDRAFFQDAPSDQQLGVLRDDERLELMHPARWQFRKGKMTEPTTEVSIHERVEDTNTRPPRMSRSAGSSPRATARPRGVTDGRAIG